MTLTAPGADRLPWDLTKCTHHPDARCAGALGCVVEARALAEWHHDIGQRWSWWVTEMRRKLGVDVQFFKTWELQARGALHAHALVRVEGVVSHRRFKKIARDAAIQWGFGTQCDVQAIDLGDDRTVARKAGYAAKYSTKGADELPDVQRVDPSTGELAGSLRPWSASRQWGDTVASIRARARAFAVGASPRATEETGGAPGAGGALDLNRHRYAPRSPQVPPQRALAASDAG